jgi:hypothetical protein
VEQPGVRAELLHVAADREHDRHVARHREGRARSGRAADDLVDAVLARDLHRLIPDVEPVQLDRRDDVVGAVERGAPVGRRLDARSDPELADQTPGEDRDHVQVLRADVHEAERAVGQRRRPEDVADEPLAEPAAASSDDGDLGHRCLP